MSLEHLQNWSISEIFALGNISEKLWILQIHSQISKPESTSTKLWQCALHVIFFQDSKSTQSFIYLYCLFLLTPFYFVLIYSSMAGFSQAHKMLITWAIFGNVMGKRRPKFWILFCDLLSHFLSLEIHNMSPCKHHPSSHSLIYQHLTWWNRVQLTQSWLSPHNKKTPISQCFLQWCSGSGSLGCCTWEKPLSAQNSAAQGQQQLCST